MPVALPSDKPHLRGMYWKRLLGQLSENTIWKSDAIKLIPASFDQAELEAAFCPRQTTSVVRPLAAAKETVSLLDHKRATNAGIALARLGVPLGGALRRALLSMDEQLLPSHMCSVLISVAPTADETEELRAYDGDVAALGTTERYFLELSAIPRLVPRLRAWACKQKFHVHASELLDRIEQLCDALKLLQTSEQLHASLGLLLALGNCLNCGSPRGLAPGFKLDASLAQVMTPLPPLSDGRWNSSLAFANV